MAQLGLGAAGELVYRTLLRRPGLSTPALQQMARGIDEPFEPLLASLQRRGLVRRSADEWECWQATPPEVAIELLLMERQAELNEARRVLPDLQADLARDSSSTSVGDVQIVVADPNEQLHAYLKLYERAQSCILTFVRPPFLVAAPEQMEAAREAARKRGVRVRSILAPEVMAWDGWQAAAEQAVAAGDELRVLEGLPFKLLLVDGTSGMLPLHADDPQGPVLRLGNTAVLQALVALFEQHWLAAVPVLEMAAGQTDPSADGDVALQELATVLAAGANDKTAAHALGISDRTLQRRMAALTAQLRAKSRFQAGWLAARLFDR